MSKVLISRFNDAKTAINSKFQIDSYLKDKGINIESNRQICCPFHDDGTPSFSVNTTKNVWKCFGCPDGGHYLDLWMKYENKYNSKQYTPFLAVEKILSDDLELQRDLGFTTIFQEESDDYNYFEKVKESAKSNGILNFEKPLERKQKLPIVSTTSMLDVMRSLKNVDIDIVIQFIADCELAMSESDLISKYCGKGDIINSYIAEITDTKDSSAIAAELRGILQDE